MKRTLTVVFVLALLFVSTGFAQETYNHDAVELTLRMQDGIHLDTTLYHSIDSLLTRARTATDEVLSIHTFPAFLHDRLIVDDAGEFFAETWGAGVLLTGNRYIDSLGTEYGLDSIKSSYSNRFYILYFSKPAHMSRLAELYKEDAQVEWAQPDGFAGDGDDIVFRSRPDEHLFGFSHGEGDCPAGCIYRYWWMVRLPKDGDAELVQREHRYDEVGYPLWNLRRTWESVIAPGIYESAQAVIDSAQSASKWYRREHAIMSSVWLLENRSRLSSTVLQSVSDELSLRMNELSAIYNGYLSGDDADLAAASEDALKHFLPPYPFTIGGVNRSELADWTISFSWSQAFPKAFADSFEYVFEIRDVAHKVVSDRSLLLQAIVQEYGLQQGTEYLWRVTARHKSDPNRSKVTDWKNFSLRSNFPLKVFHLGNPKDGVVIESPDSDFQIKYGEAYAVPVRSRSYSVKATRYCGDTVEEFSMGLSGEAIDVSLSFMFPLLDSDQEPSRIEWYVKAYEWSSGPDVCIIRSEEVWTLSYTPSMVSVSLGSESLPDAYAVQSLYPNPFNPTLTAVVSLPQLSHLKLEVYNLLGQRVAMLSDGVQEAGWRHFVFDGTNLASGVYLLRVSVPGKLEQIRKITLVR